MACAQRLVRADPGAPVIRLIPIRSRTLAAAALAVAASGCMRAQIVIPNPYPSSYEFYRGIYRADRRAVQTGSIVRGVIVPHHLVAAESTALGIRLLQNQRIDRILLISPDHFHRCPVVACTARTLYHTAFGDVRANDAAVSTLEQSSLIADAPTLFAAEHGVHAVVPFIAQYLPSVPVTPIVLSQKIPWKDVREELLGAIDRAVDDRTAIVVSSDFSHYLPLAQANEMDDRTIAALTLNNTDGIKNLRNPQQSDCPNCLWMLTALAEKRSFAQPEELMHTNSAELLGDPSITSTTSHFVVIWRDEREE